MKPIKIIAGDILLYFYLKQREKGAVLYKQLLFEDSETVDLPIKDELTDELKKIAKPADIYNALRYLSDYGYMDYQISTSTAGDSLYNFRVTAPGVDIIEGIERDAEAKERFTVNFNIKLADNITVESLLKAQLGSLFNASLFGMGS